MSRGVGVDAIMCHGWCSKMRGWRAKSAWLALKIKNIRQADCWPLFRVMSHVGRAKVVFLLLGEREKYLHILIINNMGYVLG